MPLLLLWKKHVSGRSMSVIVQEGRLTGDRPGVNARIVLPTGTMEDGCLSDVEDFIGRTVTKRTNTTRKFCLIVLPKSFPFFQLAIIGYNHILHAWFMPSAFTSITSFIRCSVLRTT